MFDTAWTLRLYMLVPVQSYGFSGEFGVCNLRKHQQENAAKAHRTQLKLQKRQ